ncbi:MAG: hypothetical protein ACLFMX_06185 [Halobacteriales archaeon]
MSADKRIPVSEETRNELHNLKKPGQTYDELLSELAQLQRRKDLERRFSELEAQDADDLSQLDDV